ncbi:MAG: CDP-alcohol phosphatidyltransferase family protein [Pseudohongiella sp.]|nr:CDP-alcohol phosphatidyltransferase family protein [Pseudohongiella sp.]
MSGIKTETSTIALAGFAGLLLCALGLGSFVSPEAALCWALVSTLIWMLVWQQTHSRLQGNRADASSPLFSDLGWANRMTIGRGWLIAATGGFLAIPDALPEQPILVWIAAAAYSIAAIFDRLDGFVARKTQRGSLLGAELDTVFDALGLIVAPLLALQLGKIHWSYLLVSVAYYLFMLGIQYRKRSNKAVYPLASSKLRRTLAGFQMAYVAVVLWPPFQAEVTVLSGFGFMLPLLAGFLVDWFVVSGRINPYDIKTAHLFGRIQLIVDTVLLPALRLLMLPAVYYIAAHSQWNVISLLIAGLAMLMIVPGLAGRAGAMALMMLLAWTVPAPITESVMLLVLFSAIAIVLLGCGRFSLWQADDDWVNRQDGA